MEAPKVADAVAPAFQLSHVSLRGRDGHPILQDINWQLPTASVGVVVGASGSGKSHLLRLLNRLSEASDGAVSVLGKPIDQWHPAELRRLVGWVPQRPQLAWQGTARAALLVMTQFGIVDADVADSRADAALRTCGLSADILDKQVSVLSGGERHRLAIARALIVQPRLVLLDEPSASLHGAAAVDLLSQLTAELRSRGGTVVIVTHRIEDVRTVGGEIVVLDQGRIVRSGASAAVLADASGFDVRQLLTGRQARGQANGTT